MAGLTQGQREHLSALMGILDREALLELRGLVDDRLAELEEEGQEASSDNGTEEGSGSGGRGYIELKMIRGYGPYAYQRWREKGRLRSKYLGKVEKQAGPGS